MTILNMSVLIFINNILQGIFWMFCMNSMLQEKHHTFIKNISKLVLICMGIIGIDILNSKQHLLNFYDVLLIMFLTFLIGLIVYYNQFILKKLLLCMVTISVIATVLTVYVKNEITVTSSLVVSVWIITIIYAICLIAQKLRHYFSWNIEFGEFYVLIVIVLCFLYSLIKAAGYSQNNIDAKWNTMQYWVCWGLCINVVFYYVVGSIYESFEKIIETRLMELSYEHSEYSADKIMHMYEEASKIRHDMKNCMAIVDKCIEHEDYVEARKYIDTLMEEKIDVLGIKRYCSNKVLNYIINTKFAICKKKHIETKCIISANLNCISDIDLSILIGNLLDNAIEAAQKTVSGMLNIEIYEEENITLIIENTINESVIQNNHIFATTKQNKSKHGFGMVSIKDIVRKYRGTIEYSENENVITCQVVLEKAV